MRIMGVDPGLASTGWGLILYPEGSAEEVQWGTIKTSPEQDTVQRLQQIHEQLRLLVIEHKPDVVAVEKIFFSRNVKTAIMVAQARGVALLATADACEKIAEYTPNEIKKAVTGRGGASKAQVQKMVATLLGLKEIPRPNHAADALAAALCHGHAAKIQRLLKQKT